MGDFKVGERIFFQRRDTKKYDIDTIHATIVDISESYVLIEEDGVDYFSTGRQPSLISKKSVQRPYTYDLTQIRKKAKELELANKEKPGEDSLKIAFILIDSLAAQVENLSRKNVH